MSAPRTTMDNPLTGGIKPVLVAVLRIAISSWAVFACYYWLPVQSEQGKSDLPYLLLNVALFAVIVIVQVPVILRSRHPGLRAVESTVLTILVYLVLYARIYLSAAATDPAAFSEALSRTRALYFTVTIFATVGFGDIVATVDATRVMVIVQMLLNLVVLGLVIRVLFTAGTRGMERKRDGGDHSWLTSFVPWPTRQPADASDPTASNPAASNPAAQNPAAPNPPAQNPPSNPPTPNPPSNPPDPGPSAPAP